MVASAENWFVTGVALGITRGVAPGAMGDSLAALTPVLIKVPIRIPIESVNRIRLEDKSFCLRNLSIKRMLFL